MGSRSKGLHGAIQSVVTVPGRKRGHVRRARGPYMTPPAALDQQQQKARDAELRTQRNRRRAARAETPRAARARRLFERRQRRAFCNAFVAIGHAANRAPATAVAS